MYHWQDLIRPMELQEAVNFLGASRKQYNKNTGEGLTFQETFDMIEECAPNCGTNKDQAMMKALNSYIEAELEKLEAKLWKELAKSVDVKAVNQMLKDPELFDESDEYTMTDDEYEDSDHYDEDLYY